MKSMNQAILAVLIATFSSPAFAGPQKVDFRCTNQIFRDASVEVNGMVVRIADSHAPVAVEQALEKALGTNKDVLVSKVTLEVGKQAGGCKANPLKLVTCQAQNIKGVLQVQGWIAGMRAELNLPVEVSSLDLRSSLHSSGPLVLSAKGATSVELNTLKVAAHATVRIGQDDVTLPFDLSFNTKSTSPTNGCTKL